MRLGFHIKSSCQPLHQFDIVVNPLDTVSYVDNRGGQKADLVHDQDVAYHNIQERPLHRDHTLRLQNVGNDDHGDEGEHFGPLEVEGHRTLSRADRKQDTVEECVIHYPKGHF